MDRRCTIVPMSLLTGLENGGHAPFGLSGEKAKAPEQSTSRIWLCCPDRLTRL
jgi:hypothetical protein